MPFIEAPTSFYLGRRYDPGTHRVTDDVVYYDSRDLTTHAVVLGMTGSGKTGLCITLLEEAILDNIPAIIIDPKGDITNLLLTFPNLQPSDFQPWVNIDDARRAGMEVDQYAHDIAQRWRDGLASWGMVPDRIRWLKQASKYTIYTPGSDSGVPISILASLRAPRDGWAGNEEAHRERINGIVSALLALIGRESRPVQDKDHVLVSNIFEYAWQRGQNLTLEELITQVQRPPFNKLGVFPVDDYMSEKDRYKLAMELNNIIAAPSFQSWINGEPIDIHHLLYQPDGRPRVSIFYIAHLNETERRFIITLLLENMLGWMRTLSGTTSLRALLYVDEMFGYFPPYPKNPPTKEPMLRLLKQARAFGLGMILATQNPGDLDYKGLSNAGTWFIGRLQSDNDKAKVMTGLRSMVSADSNMNLKEVEQLISDIEPRVFLMHNIHDEGGPVLLHTRWAMSFLRGPLTRQQVQLLMADQRQQMISARVAAQAAAGASPYAGGGYNPQMGFAAQSAPAYAPPPPSYAPPPPPPSLPGMPPPPPSIPDLPEFDTAPAPPEPFDPYQMGYTPPPPPMPVVNTPPPPPAQPQRASVMPGYSNTPPSISAAVAQYFVSPLVSNQQALAQWEQQTRFRAQSVTDARLAYRPVLLAQATVRYQNRKTNMHTARVFSYQVPQLDNTGLVHWDEFEAPPVDPKSLVGKPAEPAMFADISPGLSDSKRLTVLKRELTDVLYNTATLKVPYNSTLDIYGDANGEFSEFRARVTQAAREQRDAAIDKLTKKYEGILEKLEEKMRTTAQKLESEKRELAQEKRIELFTTGEAVAMLLQGRFAYTLSRMAQASLYRKRSRGDVEQYRTNLTELDEEIAQIEQEFEKELKDLNQYWANIAQQNEEYLITPFKKDIFMELFGIGWIPMWYMNINGQPVLLPA